MLQESTAAADPSRNYAADQDPWDDTDSEIVAIVGDPNVACTATVVAAVRTANDDDASDAQRKGAGGDVTGVSASARTTARLVRRVCVCTVTCCALRCMLTPGRRHIYCS
jgi:hypothetical protein